jgi:hypothetical protein
MQAVTKSICRKKIFWKDLEGGVGRKNIRKSNVRGLSAVLVYTNV